LTESGSDGGGSAKLYSEVKDESEGDEREKDKLRSLKLVFFEKLGANGRQTNDEEI
jgi:hypothetical protein